MAKKSTRMLVSLVCKECKQQNYITEKSKLNSESALVLNKYCKKCKKQTQHKESKKLD
ncbi:MAG: 50S ribosomal protein L33 [Candidatus Roizmanbacteria bacterium GW2011_GWA2_37_7]|uniref:Large ribosomal subunit protein bL33 n=1 Tax=Candidatus Roizmanbacteria bacterium GW2011_GWA2_37_7 TaxID=1618481 RepID=A0A0G0HIC5_9BACT|nr:MAG: 50S ribosomal protein L33 [Candidatus Roizmanbacteria bacterium GW2011_GWA2_37_7]